MTEPLEKDRKEMNLREITLWQSPAKCLTSKAVDFSLCQNCTDQKCVQSNLGTFYWVAMLKLPSVLTVFLVLSGCGSAPHVTPVPPNPPAVHCGFSSGFGPAFC